MSYVALYRKYRPKTFDEVYGQSAIVQTLKNQVNFNRIGHAYLFSGPRGTGKTSISKMFARAINCQNPTDGNPCLQCECCQKYAEGLNVDIIEIDAASNNGVDNIRELIEESKYMPQHGKYKVYIIDEVHMLSTNAFNALLKTLEEPTPNVVFILATTEEHKVPATIYSRCQRYQFKLIDNEDIVNALKHILTSENIEWEDDAVLHYIAKLAKGGLRDALSLMDQCVTFSASEKITMGLAKEVFGEVHTEIITLLANAIQSKNIKELLDIVQDQISNGKSLTSISSDLYDYFREKCLEDTGNVIYQRYMQILAALPEKMKYNNSRTIFEIEMIKLCTPQMESNYTALQHRIQQLEDIISNLTNGANALIQTVLPCYDENEFVSFSVGAPISVSTEIYYI